MSIPRAEAVKVIQQFEKNPMFCTTELLQWSTIPRSTYYYKRSEGFVATGIKISVMNSEIWDLSLSIKK